MSTIDKLLIRGIRSFDPDTPSVIEFYSPLTLIIGKNGCGKTTIIECLKYATTGELPPNSKGGAFVHDPKLAGEVEVKAQVKLKFKNVNSKNMVCTRSLQVTQKKTGVSMQTLESVLFISPNKATGQEKASISTKCAELDAEMPLQLGISKAILESVIFCHQEESNWPLSEPIALKKRFDDIFSATRYTKAVDTLKKLRKDQTVELKIQSNDLKHSEENKKKSDKLKRDINSLNESSDNLASKIHELSYNEEKCHSKFAEFEELAEEFMRADSNVKKLVHEKALLDDNLKDVLEHIDLMSESTSELETIIAEQEPEKYSLQRTIDDYNSKISRCNQSIEGFQSEISQNQLNLGKYQSLKDTYDQEVKRRKELSLEVYNRHKEDLDDLPYLFSTAIANSNGNLQISNEGVDHIIDLVNTKYKLYTEKVNKDRLELTKHEEGFRNKVQSLNLSRAQNKQIVSQLQEQIHNKKMQLNKLENAINSAADYDAELQALRDNLSLEQSKLKDATDTRDEANISIKTQVLRKKLDQVDRDMTMASEEATRMQVNSEMHAKTDMLKKSIETKNAELEKIMSLFKERLEGKVQNSEEYQEIIDYINKQTTYIKGKFETMQDSYRALDINVASKKSKLSFLQTNLKKYKAELDEKDRTLLIHIKGENYDSCVLRLQNKVDRILEDIGKNKNIMLMYKEYIEEVKLNEMCPLCLRTWKSTDDKDDFTQKLQNKYDSSPSLVEKAEKQLELAQSAVNDLRSIQPIVEGAHTLRAIAIPELESEIIELEEQVEELLAEQSQANYDRDLLEKELKSINTLKTESIEFIKIKNALDKEKVEYQTYLEKLDKGGTTKSATECREYLNSLQGKSRDLRNQLDTLSIRNLEFQQAISAHENKVSQLKNKISEVQQKLYQKEVDSQLKADTSAEIENFAQKIAESSRFIDSAESSFLDEQRRHMELNQLLQKQIDESSRESDYWSAYKSTLDELNNSLAKFEHEIDIESALKNAQSRIDELNNKVSETQVRISGFRSKIFENEKWKNNYEQKVRQVYDNIKKRKLDADLVEAGDKIKSALAQKEIVENNILQVINECRNDYFSQGMTKGKKPTHGERSGVLESSDPSSDETYKGYSTLKPGRGSKRSANKISESKITHYPLSKKQNFRTSVSTEVLSGVKTQLRATLDEISVGKASLIGEKKQIEAQINHYQSELRISYKNIDDAYIEKMISFQSLELAQMDLGKYTKALDNAIMQYHSLKMEEVNKIIRELWVNTYMASDIDTIEIRSESETTKANRSYNYRVVMIKGGQALDMRGRCSAGQKVLASLIIRLALPETFALNCGILALDEPTTNLDKVNVESLARSLSRIIASRYQRSKFQFIIITHDEDFLEMLGKSDLTDYYWRVYKNQSQFSSVEKMAFLE